MQPHQPTAPLTSTARERVALVTGGGRGIGQAVARTLARRGIRVVVCDKGTAVDGSAREDRSVAQATAAKIVADGGEAIGLGIDVTEPAAVETAFATAAEHWGEVDIVINAAGIIRDRMLWNVAPEEWDDVMRVHLRACYALAGTLARRMRAAARPPADVSLTTFSSSAGVLGNIGSSSYGAAKAGVIGFTRIAAMELARFGVRANCVVPFAYTRMADQLPSEGAAAEKRLEGIRRLTPDQVASLVLWLATCGDPAVTGQLIGIRGREVFVFAQPRIELRIALENTEPEHLAEVLGGWLPERLPPLQPSSAVFGYEPYA